VLVLVSPAFKIFIVNWTKSSAEVRWSSVFVFGTEGVDSFCVTSEGHSVLSDVLSFVLSHKSLL
jgi:hypothetical protein